MSTWKDDANINRHRLDDECCRMPNIYSRWADYEQKACAAEDLAQHRLQLAEDAYKTTLAKAHLQLRGCSTSKINSLLDLQLDPTKTLTEAQFKDATQLHPEVRASEQAILEARIEYIQKKAHRREMQAARFTMDVKDRALKKIVDLSERMYGMSGSYQPSPQRPPRNQGVRSAVTEVLANAINKPQRVK